MTSAVRIVPEWTSYDTEIKQLQDTVAAATSKEETTDSQGKIFLSICVLYFVHVDPNDLNDIRNYVKRHEEL